jgi:hypothetical protein
MKMSNGLSIIAVIAVSAPMHINAAALGFTNLETKLEAYSFNADDQKFLGNISGSYAFRDNYFVNASVGFGEGYLTRNSAALGLGLYRMAGARTALFSSIGMQRYEFLEFSNARVTDVTTAALSVGVKSLLSDNMELEFGATKLQKGIYSARVGLKGTYYFSDSMGAVVEFGSSDSDGFGGVGVRWRF